MHMRSIWLERSWTSDPPASEIYIYQVPIPVEAACLGICWYFLSLTGYIYNKVRLLVAYSLPTIPVDNFHTLPVAAVPVPCFISALFYSCFWPLLRVSLDSDLGCNTCPYLWVCIFDWDTWFSPRPQLWQVVLISISEYTWDSRKNFSTGRCLQVYKIYHS